MILCAFSYSSPPPFFEFSSRIDKMEQQSSHSMFYIHFSLEKCMHYVIEFQDINISQILLDGVYDFLEFMNPVRRLLNCEQISLKSDGTTCLYCISTG